PQTTCERTLEIIGRKHSISSFFEKYELARSFGFDAINTDLIAGLPGETEEDLMKSVSDCRNLGAENITVHTLAIKKGSRFGMQNAHHFVDEKTAEMMVLHSRELLENSGYRPYYMYRQKYMAGNMENTGYALPGKECIYNIDIMEEEVSILAFGAGAASKRVDREGKKISRTVGLKDVRQYIERIEEMAGNKLELFSEGK
ncbi:MAG: coproporphyrinogen dehydrogenase HemZ, partial [Clostridia bacterium]|nr:coproporphyrinogen dehydrogenase HemZ [Clostridia bacterium]